MKVCPRYEKVIERSRDVDEHLQVQGLRFAVQGLGFRVLSVHWMSILQCLGFRVQGSGS